jgi:hypothetical protein
MLSRFQTLMDPSEGEIGLVVHLALFNLNQTIPL